MRTDAAQARAATKRLDRLSNQRAPTAKRVPLGFLVLAHDQRRVLRFNRDGVPRRVILCEHAL